MSKFFIFAAAGLVALVGGCQKQQTEAERNAEIERQVNERLAAEHQTQEQQQLAQRQNELDARLRALSEQQQRPTGTPEPQQTERGTGETFEGRPAGSNAVFYTRLEPFGVWRETSTYGYLWQPREAMESRSWRPYTNGHWVYTDAGWTWISEEPFGWATYHYGRWTRLRGIGWVWVPDNEWAPAWVSWRVSNDYVGWAPLPPEARFEHHTGIHNWADNYYDIGPQQYCFVPTPEIGTERIARVVVPPEQNVMIVNETTNVTNITYNNTTVVNQGPSYDELRARSHQPIARLRLERRATLETENPRPIVKGEIVEMPAPVMAPPRAFERPVAVKERIAETVVEGGWEGIADQQAAQRARAKIKSEATPPPNLPAKTFVRPAPITVETRSSGPSPRPTAAPIGRLTNTPAAPSPLQTPTTARAARPLATAMPSRPLSPPVAPAQSAAPMATPLATPAPMSTRAVTAPPRATATPASAPAAIRPTATPVSTPTPSARPAFSPRTLPPQRSPRLSPPAALSATPAAAPRFGRIETKEQREAQKEVHKQERAARRQERLQSVAPAPAASGTASLPASSLGPAAERPKHERRPSEAAISPTATPTASPSL